MGGNCCQTEKQQDSINNHQWTLYSRMSKELDDGCQYTGAWHNGKPNGQGRAQWPDGWVFEGNFSDGKPHRGNLRSPALVVEPTMKLSAAGAS